MACSWPVTISKMESTTFTTLKPLIAGGDDLGTLGLGRRRHARLDRGSLLLELAEALTLRAPTVDHRQQGCPVGKVGMLGRGVGEGGSDGGMRDRVVR